MADDFYKVVVLDMQPIEPPVGGGRLRLLGLYHDLGENLPTTYIGTYDWPGEKYRRHRLSMTLEEIDIPLSDEHFSASNEWQKRVNGKTIIDTAFHQLGHLSPQFVEYAQNQVIDADIVIFSHPWVYPLVKEKLGKNRQLVVYDSQNVEGVLRTTLLDDGGFGTEIVKKAVMVEYELCHLADLVLACSHEDRELFHRLYGVPYTKVRIVPNGVFIKHIVPAGQDTKERIKKELGLDGRPLVIFLGSYYPPNVEAANFICQSLAPNLPHIMFAICGGIGDGLNKDLGKRKTCTNIRVTGFLNEEQKLSYLRAADLAINPMFSGSGTNIKMFDFMAAGLPIISTPVGARGIEGGSDNALLVVPEKDFATMILQIIENSDLKISMSKSARNLVEEKYSWERISKNLGFLLNRWRSKMDTKPFFTVIIPTYERHDYLSKLMKFLTTQKWQDFEVIVVDQSQEKWPGRNESYVFDFFYIHTEIKSTAKARNLGAFYARGEVLAFTDDDCEPRSEWLRNAFRYFSRPDVIGIEGLIRSDKIGDPDYRTVTNEGFEGIGFMTANLFIKSDIFNSINGFDEAFDIPFREDTDLAWRALEYGKIPYGNDVEVFHPPHPRNIERESNAERSRFFEKDALLLKKHPDRYRDLFLKERHWENAIGFWDNLFRGAKKYGIEIPDFYLSFMKMDSKNKKSAQVVKNESFEVKSGFANEIMANARIDLDLEVPPFIATHMGSARTLLSRIEELVGEATHGDYFCSSTPRYLHTLATAMTLPAKASVLEVGGAPGHISIGFYLLGLDLVSINLNEAWRSTYPSQEWVRRLGVVEHDIEKAPLPFDKNSFDAVYFTEVLEHVAIKNPVEVLKDFKRVLKPDGMLVLSTPNVCNISNIIALLNGVNIFWPLEKFYGGLERHNREYTPKEVYDIVKKAGFKEIKMYGINSYCNWRYGTGDVAYRIIGELGDNHPLLRNTIMLCAFKI